MLSRELARTATQSGEDRALEFMRDCGDDTAAQSADLYTFSMSSLPATAPPPRAIDLGTIEFHEGASPCGPDLMPTALVDFFEAEGIAWSRGRTAADWRTLLDSSLLLTAWLRPNTSGTTPRLVGSTRLRSDFVYEAKLHDVVTAREFAGLGIATTLVCWALAHPWAGRVTRFVLETNGAESLYTRFGFRDAAAHHTTHMRARVDELRR